MSQAILIKEEVLPPASWGDVCEVVEARVGLHPSKIGDRRDPQAGFAKMLIAYLAHEMVGMSYPEIARAMQPAALRDRGFPAAHSSWLTARRRAVDAFGHNIKHFEDLESCLRKARRRRL